MPLRWAKYSHESLRSKPVLYNSQKNASIKKVVFQNGLRLAKYSQIKEIILRGIVSPGHPNFHVVAHEQHLALFGGSIGSRIGLRHGKMIYGSGYGGPDMRSFSNGFPEGCNPGTVNLRGTVFF